MKYSLNGMSFPVKAEVIGKHIQGLIDKNNGQVTPEIVLNSAKRKNSKIHSCFEWNDTKAAQKYRLNQARRLISAVVIVEGKGKDKITTKAFVNIATDDEGKLTHNPFETKNRSFVSVGAVMQSDPLKHYTLESALLEMDRFRKKYDNLKEFEKIFKELDKIKKKQAA